MSDALLIESSKRRKQPVELKDDCCMKKPKIEADQTIESGVLCDSSNPSTEAELTNKVAVQDDLKTQEVSIKPDLKIQTTDTQSLLDKIDMKSTSLSEEQVGISKHINPNLPTFSAILKHRFTDFLVYEVNTSDQVIRLRDIGDPRPSKGVENSDKPAKSQLSVPTEWPEDADAKLETILGKDKLLLLQKYVSHGPPKKKIFVSNEKKNGATRAFGVEEKATDGDKISKNCNELVDSQMTPVKDATIESKDDSLPKSIVSDPIDSKERRRAFHQAIRELFSGRLVTEHKELEGGDSAIEISWALDRKNMQRKPKQIDVNPPYIHFTLQKTNRETQDALSILARLLHCHVSRDLSICGTKDKRAVSCQRVSLKKGRRTLEEVWAVINQIKKNRDYSNSDLLKQRGDKGIRVGDFTYEQDPLKLGQLNGNRFVIVLRHIIPPEPEILKEAVQTLSTYGFLNYFGMQRFGTTAIGTHLVGLSLLRADWDLAIDLIMRKKPGEAQEMELARSVWEDTKDAKVALDLMPRRCIAERSILQFYSKQTAQTDKCGALGSIPKNLRMMYIHAYQSYLWNVVLSHRVELFGCSKPVVGDLVQINKKDVSNSGDASFDLGAMEDTESDTLEYGSAPLVKVLKTDKDCEAYTIHDVVLPLPGYNIIYPENELKGRFLKIMRQDGLDPDNLYRRQAEYSMPGTYRKIMHQPKDVDCNFFAYEDPDLPLTQADEDVLLGMELPDLEEWTSQSAEKNKSLAMKVEFTLASSTYATMALREILKSDTSLALPLAKPPFTNSLNDTVVFERVPEIPEHEGPAKRV
ncbi:hypothetical protein O181_039509 [Austropuccinia psidii MF-1]|uniref:TRUD domain-containing protein n=1 Tax=Austropuccinia psidii MF-1 TaxID=1389203 RepID=A0A9Q3HEM0_9BASI|nr:hypothetical protein [Austropuccinia psidii MF-1]